MACVECHDPHKPALEPRVPFRAPQTISFPDEQPTNIRYWVLGAFCVAAAIAYIQRYSINLLAPSIRETTGLDEEQIGGRVKLHFRGEPLPRNLLDDAIDHGLRVVRRTPFHRAPNPRSVCR